MGIIVQTFNKILELLKLSERKTDSPTVKYMSSQAAKKFIESLVGEVTQKHLRIVVGIEQKKAFDELGIYAPEDTGIKEGK